MGGGESTSIIKFVRGIIWPKSWAATGPEEEKVRMIDWCHMEQASSLSHAVETLACDWNSFALT